MHGETRRGTREFIGARIRRFREARGLSVLELSNLSDIPELMLATIERGRMRITFENMICIARSLDTPLVEFFDDGRDGDDAACRS